MKLIGIAVLILTFVVPTVYAEAPIKGVTSAWSFDSSKSGGEKSLIDYTIGIATSLQKVFRDRVWSAPVPHELRLQMAINEYESAQLVIVPLIDKLEGVKVTCSDLTAGEGKNRISRENVDIRLVGYVYLPSKPALESGCSEGWYPDPLLSHKKPFDISDRVVQPIWITVYTPPGTIPGEYKGTLTIQTSKSSSHLPISVKVWDFELSQELLPTDFAFRVGQIVRFYYGAQEVGKAWEHVPPSIYRKYLKFLLSYRITPQFFDEAVGGSTSSISYLREGWEGDKLVLDFEEFDKNVELMRGSGARFIRVGYFGGRAPTGEHGRFWKSYLPQLYKHLKEKGWLDTSYIYLWDEPSFENYNVVKEQAALIGKLAPGLKCLDTYGSRSFEEYFTDGPERYIDIWVPLIPTYSMDFHQQRKEKGEIVFFYVCCSPARPNFFVFQPSMEHRILFWVLQKYEADGFLYWGTSYWQPNAIDDIEEDGSPKKSWNPMALGRYPPGDGYLLYPAGRNIEDGVNPSIRLEVIRDGLEDLEYFRILKQRLKELKMKGRHKYQGLIEETEKVLEIDSNIVEDKTTYTNAPENIYQRRKEVGSLIEKNSSLLGR